MNVAELFSIIRKHIVSILAWGVGGLLLFLLFAIAFVAPKYSSSIDILVNQKTDNAQAQYTAQQTDLRAINTYKDILRKPVILQPTLNILKEKDNYSGSLEDLAKTISINNETDSLVMTVSVKDKNAYVARDAANTIGEIFSKKIKKMMKIDNVAIVSKAKVDNKVVFPNKKIFSLAGLVMGLLIGLLVAIIRDMNDTTVKDSSYLTDQLGLVDLGVIYHIPNSDNSYNVVYVKNQNDNGEQLRRRV